jgi:hypothetical protein
VNETFTIFVEYLLNNYKKRKKMKTTYNTYKPTDAKAGQGYDCTLGRGVSVS